MVVSPSTLSTQVFLTLASLCSQSSQSKNPHQVFAVCKCFTGLRKQLHCDCGKMIGRVKCTGSAMFERVSGLHPANFLTAPLRSSPSNTMTHYRKEVELLRLSITNQCVNFEMGVSGVLPLLWNLVIIAGCQNMVYLVFNVGELQISIISHILCLSCKAAD